MMLRIFLYTTIIFHFTSSVLASYDVFDEISRSLEKPEAHQKQSFYPIDVFKALVDRDSYILYKELYLSSYYSTELRQIGGRNSIGIIIFGTFSGPKGQIGDANVQCRATYYNNQFIHGIKMGREYTEGLNDFELELHNAYLRLRVLPSILNVRIGHFYIPYGIQPWIDTHGTLLEGPAMIFVGLDRDWGIAIEGQNNILEYQLGLTRGSGMEYFEEDGNFIIAGKLSTPRIGERVSEWLGVSFLTGKLFDPMNTMNMATKYHVIEKWRSGVDGQKTLGPVRLRFEISGGQDARKKYVLGQFMEIRYALGKNNPLLASIQFENLAEYIKHTDRRDHTTIRFGLVYNLSANYNIQSVISKDINTVWGKKDTWLGLLFYGQKGGGILRW